MNFFAHPNSLCESTNVGDGTRVWAFAHVLPGARIGRDCNVCDHVFIENDVVVGDRVTIKCGVQLWDGARIGDDVFIGPNASFTNDPFPRSRQKPAKFVETTIEPGASIGANCTILPGLRIGRGAMIGAGSVVTRDVPPYAIVVGNPGAVVGYADALQSSKAPRAPAPNVTASPYPMAGRELKARGAKVVDLRVVSDPRGDLMVAEFERQVPFTAKRVFCVYSVPSREIRGEHAHRACHQFLVAINGQLSVMVDDGEHRDEVLLDRKSIGLYMPPMIWGVQYKFSPDAVLLVFASDYYDPDDYIRSYDEFRETLSAHSFS